MKEGDRVHLTKDVGPCSAGDEGVVRQIDAQGRMTVEITHRADCTPFAFLLVGVLPEEVAFGTVCQGAAAPRSAAATRTEAKPAGKA